MEQLNNNQRTHHGTIASLIGILVNILLSGCKIFIGTIFGIISVVADGINNLTDCGSSVISILSFKLSSKPADKEHPYGHERIEYVCSLVVAFIILLVVFETVKEAISKIVSPTPLTFSVWVIVVLVLSVMVKFLLYFYYKAVASKIDSSILKATAVDSLSDCISTSVVLISFFISKLVGYNIDGYAGIFVSFFIAYSAIGVLKEIFSTLIGKAPNEQLLHDIKNKVLTYPNVLGVHDLAVFSYGPNKYYASVHVEMDAKLDVLVAHEIVDQIEKDFIEELGIVLTGHLDPIVTDDPRVNDLRTKIEDIVHQMNSEFSIHDFRMVFGENRTNVLFDVAVPFACKLTKEQIKQHLEEQVALIDKRYCLVVTIEQCI